MYHLIVNGSIKSEKLEKNVGKVGEVFRKAGKEITVYKTERKGHAKEISRSLTENGKFAEIIAMGGDGTLHEVLNGIEDTESCTLGLIPFGSGNDFAHAADIPENVVRAAENIAFRAPSYIDYIELENGLRSINAVGSGMDVDVLKRTYSDEKGRKHRYLSALISSLKHYECTDFAVSYDGGEPAVHHGLIVCLGNGTQIGGGIKLFPEAKINDGFMDLIVVDYISRLKTIGALIKLKTGRVNKVKGVTHVKCKTASFIPVGGNAPIQAEGEIYEGVELKARLVSEKLKFYLPEND